MYNEHLFGCAVTFSISKRLRKRGKDGSKTPRQHVHQLITPQHAIQQIVTNATGKLTHLEHMCTMYYAYAMDSTLQASGFEKNVR